MPLKLNRTLYTVNADLNTKASVDSPALEGTPTAPTPSVGDNSTKLATTAFVAEAASGNLLRVTTFTSSGTWTKQSDVNFIIIEIVGGGSGGARLTGQGRAAGGSGGGYSRGLFTSVQLGNSQSVVIGAGGINSPGSGAGGTTSFGSLMSATGGAASGNFAAGAPGVGSGGFLNFKGNYGGNGLATTDVAATAPASGWGGTPGGLLQSQTTGNTTQQFGANAPANSGCGGQGGYTAGSSDAFGGTGGSGFVIIYEYGY